MGDVPENLPVISRPRGGAIVGGVCAGLAQRWKVDPNLLRISIVVLAFFGGLGLAAYGAGLLLMPREGQPEMPVRRFLPFTRSWSTPTVVAATIGALVVVVGLTSSGGIGLGPVIVIFAIWFFGFRNHGSSRPGPPPEPTPFERKADAWRQRLAEQNTPGYEAVTLLAPTGQRWTQPYTDPASDLVVRDDDPLPVRRSPRPRNWRLWWLALASVGVAVAVVALLGVAGIAVGPLAYASAVLAGLGLTLVVATWAGRPPLLFPATIIAALAVVSLVIPPVPNVGEVHRSYSTAAELPERIDLGAGKVELDLSALQLTEDTDLTVKVGAGSVALELPVRVTSEVNYSIDAGEFNGSFNAREGLSITGTETVTRGSGSPVLRIWIDVDLGEVLVLT